LNEKKREVYTTFAASKTEIKQMIDLALLASNLLKGKDLAEFIKRSFEGLK